VHSDPDQNTSMFIVCERKKWQDDSKIHMKIVKTILKNKTELKGLGV
jgi:hypothetical protein